MKNKPADILYCGVSEEKIKNAQPVLEPRIRHLAYQWMRDRYEVHVNKDVLKLAAPWTCNVVLQKVKFCNVKREHDRQSINLINNIVNNPRLSITDKMFNCLIFRLYNMWETIEVLGGPWTIQEFAGIDQDKAREDLQCYELQLGGKVFTNAFNTGGLKQCLAFPEMVVNHKEQRFGGMMVNLREVVATGKGHEDAVHTQMDYKEAKKLAEADPDKYSIEGWEAYMPMRIVRYLSRFLQQNPTFFDELLTLSSPKQVYEKLYSDVEGLGPFLAYQIWVDFTYIPEYPFSENEFTIAGPGCKAGIDLLFMNKGGMNHEECLFWLRDNQDEVFRQYGYDRQEFWSAEEHDYDKMMNVMQLENLHCELQKYVRCVDAVIRGEKPRGKVGYDGTGKPVVKPSGSRSLLDKMARK